jgi:hypothetical protein
MPLKGDPAEVATKYRVVKVGEGQFELHSGSGRLTLKRGGAFLHIHTAPATVRWHAEQGNQPFHAIRLSVVELNIGHRGDEGWSSGLVDDRFFVIDGEVLRYVPLSEVTVLSEEQFKVRKARLAASTGNKLTVGGQDAADSDRTLASGTITHCGALPELEIAESLDCTVGMRQLHFDKLVQGCIDGQISSVHLHGITGGLSSSFEHGALRDLIVLAGGELNVRLDSLSFEYRV